MIQQYNYSGIFAVVSAMVCLQGWCPSLSFAATSSDTPELGLEETEEILKEYYSNPNEDLTKVFQKKLHFDPCVRHCDYRYKSENEESESDSDSEYRDKFSFNSYMKGRISYKEYEVCPFEDLNENWTEDLKRLNEQERNHKDLQIEYSAVMAKWRREAHKSGILKKNIRKILEQIDTLKEERTSRNTRWGDSDDNLSEDEDMTFLRANLKVKQKELTESAERVQCYDRDANLIRILIQNSEQRDSRY